MAVSRWRRAISFVIALFGAVCMVIAATYIALGAPAVPGGVPVNATMDSEIRFYATLFLGFGVALVWCSRDLAARQPALKPLLVVFFLGGVARLISMVAVGPPSDLFISQTAVELLLPIGLWIPVRRAFSADER